MSERTRSGWRMIARVAWAMVVAPARRCRLIAMFRKVAMTWAHVPVRVWDRSSSNVVDGVLDAPVATDDLGELGWGHSVEVEVGDRVDGLGLDLPITPGAPTVHPDGLPGGWEGQASRWAHDFDRPRLHPAVTRVSAGERHLHVFPWQRCEFAGQGRTVRFGDRPRSTPRVGAGSLRARPACALRPQ
jgi:hypothetical protein